MRKMLKSRIGKMCFWLHDSRLTPMCHRVFKGPNGNLLHYITDTVQQVIIERHVNEAQNAMFNGDKERAINEMVAALGAVKAFAEMEHRNRVREVVYAA